MFSHVCARTVSPTVRIISQSARFAGRSYSCIWKRRTSAICSERKRTAPASGCPASVTSTEAGEQFFGGELTAGDVDPITLSLEGADAFVRRLFGHRVGKLTQAAV